MRTLVAASFLLAVTAAAAPAQVANPAQPAERSAALALGFDHGAVIEGGYRQPIALTAALPTSVFARLQVPSSPGLGDGGLELGATAGWLGARRLGATATLGATMRWVDGELLGVAEGGLTAGVSAGFFHPRALAALELIWEHGLVTYARPTEAYRRLVYREADAGFHGGGGGTLGAGLTSRVAVSERVALTLRAGYVNTERFELPPGLPFRLVLGGMVHF